MLFFEKLHSQRYVIAFAVVLIHPSIAYANIAQSFLKPDIAGDTIVLMYFLI